MKQEKPVELFLQIVLSLSKLVGERTGIDPLLSRSIYSYEVTDPDWGWRDIAKTIKQVEDDLNLLSPERANFIGDFLKSFAVMVREGQGEKIPYQERVRAYIQVSGDRIPDSVIENLKQELRQKFQQAGYPDDLKEAYKIWNTKTTVPDDQLIETGQEILSRARQRTNERVIQDPPEHQIELDFPKNYPYNGYSDYSEGYRGRIFLNGDIGWGLPALKHTICHESLPGHQLFSAIREQRYRDGQMPVEGTVYLANTPITPIVEGLCEIGQEMLGLVENSDDEIHDIYNRYSSAISTNLAIACNAEDMDRETAVTRLMEETFISRVYAEKRYEFWTNPLWCTSFIHYWYGREFMRKNYALMQDHLPEFYRMVYTEPHTVRTLQNRIDLFLEKQTKQ